MRRALAGALAVLVLAACAPAGPQEQTSPGGASSPTASPEEESVNPVIGDDFPDPDVVEVDGTYYAYATNGNNSNVRVARSTDLVGWETLDDALPDLPSWVIPGKTWAPEVTELDDGSFVMYFTATNYRPTFQCIGVAVSDAPEGPFTVVGDEMLVCPPEEGGAIDAATFLDEDGTRYLLWKNDGNCCGLETWIYLAPLAEDGRSLTDEATRLIRQDLPWEGNLVEAPTLVLRDDTYHLLYSANDYGGAAYTIGHATAEDVAGPYEKSEDPFFSSLDSADGYVGPGGQDVVVGPDGQDLLVFHSWYGGVTYRGMNVLPLEWTEEGPDVVEEAEGADL